VEQQPVASGLESRVVYQRADFEQAGQVRVWARRSEFES
jgi:hypothetical protein